MEAAIAAAPTPAVKILLRMSFSLLGPPGGLIFADTPTTGAGRKLDADS
jgi:hypothetical protein